MGDPGSQDRAWKGTARDQGSERGVTEESGKHFIRRLRLLFPLKRIFSLYGLRPKQSLHEYFGLGFESLDDAVTNSFVLAFGGG